MWCVTDLDGDDRSLVLTELVQLLLHVAEDDGARRDADADWLIVGAQNVLVLPLDVETRTSESVHDL